MARLCLLLIREFCHGPTAGQYEQWIVSEAAIALGRIGDMAIHFAFEGFQQFAIAGGCDHAAEMGLAFADRDAPEFVEEMDIIGLVHGDLGNGFAGVAGIAGGAHSWCATKRIDGEARIVGDDKFSRCVGVAAVLDGLFASIVLECVLVFDNLWDRGEAGNRSHLESVQMRERGEIVQLAAVGCSNENAVDFIGVDHLKKTRSQFIRVTRLQFFIRLQPLRAEARSVDELI